MEIKLSIPTIEDVERIKNIKDPVIRNLQITQCYYELSTILASRTGASANWCTFATWASKQAGQTIRKEDLARLLELRLMQLPATTLASEGIATATNIQSENRSLDSHELKLKGVHFVASIDRVGAAVARGNKKVFEEIGYAFARFYQTCPIDQPIDEQRIRTFCEELRVGDPPDGQGYLRQAFTHYAQALAETDIKTRAELILMANIEIGFHEQTRLQPEIAESLNSGPASFLQFARSMIGIIFPAYQWLHLARLYSMRLLAHPTPLDVLIQAMHNQAQALLRQVMTDIMMSITLPSGVVLRLSKDLVVGFPETLKQITNQELERFLDQHDLSLDSLSGSGALDWADLTDRLHFIIDLFRCYQEQDNLFEPPFKMEQVEALKAGRLPPGRL